MNRHRIIWCFGLLLLFTSTVSASVFGDVRGTVVDPQQRRIVFQPLALQMAQHHLGVDEVLRASERDNADGGERRTKRRKIFH